MSNIKVTFGNKQYVFINQLFYQGNQYRVFSSSDCNFMVKIYDSGQEKYLNTELQAVNIFKDSNNSYIAKSYEGEISQQNAKVIVIEKADVLQNILKDVHIEEQQIIKILLDLSRALKFCHTLGITHRDIRPENVLIGTDKNAKLWNFQRCFFQQYETLPQEYILKIKEEIEINTLQHVRAPEQKDLSNRFPITKQVDVYALGQLIYYMMYRVRYDQNPTFPAQNPNYRVQLQELLKRLLLPNPKQRLTAEQIEQYILEKILIQQLPTQIHIRSLSTNEKMNKEMHSARNESDKFPQIEFFDIALQQQQPSNFSAKVVKLIGKVAQKTDCWVQACLEEVDSAPNQQYFRFLHGKAWQKREKIPKFYEKLLNRLQLDSVIITFKALQLLHNYIKKGPQESLAIENKNYDPLTILEKIKQHQELNQMKSSRDKYRNQYFTNLLTNYSIVLMEKLKFHKFYSKFFEGNFAMIPFFNGQSGNQRQKISIALLRNLIGLWKRLNQFAQCAFGDNNLINLQLGLAISMADELYNILSTCTHILFALKHSTNFVYDNSANMEEIKKNLATLEDQFVWSFFQTIDYFSICKKVPQFQQIIPDPSKNVIETIRKIPFFQQKNGEFNIYDYLSYSNSIDGIKLPQSYGEIMISQIIEYEDEVVELDPRSESFATQYPIKPVISCQPQTDRANKFNFNVEPQFTIITKQPSKQNFDEPLQQQQSGNNQERKESIKESIKINESKKKQTKQIQGEYEGLDLSDEEDENHIDEKESPNKPNTIKIANHIQITNELLNNDEFLNWGNQKASVQQKNTNGINHTGQSHRIQSANVENDQKRSINLFDQFNPTYNNIKNSQQMNQINQQNLINNNNYNQVNKQPLFQQTESIIIQPQPQQKPFEVVDYFQRQGKNVSDWMINHDQLKLDRKIGTGSSCDVFKGHWKGGEVAIKVMKIKSLSEAHLKEFRREISALVSIQRHPNLVQLIGISQKEDELFIVTEFCAGGTLFDLLHRKKHLEINWQIRSKIALQIAEGMQHLHKINPPLIHRDLKSLNLLLEQAYDQSKVNIKIADFGLARVQADNGEQMTGVLGTFHWMAPEVFKNEPYTIKADVYSFAIVLWEICARETPYKQLSTNPPAIMKFVTFDNGRPDLNLLQLGCPQYLKELMIKCWDSDANKRPAFNDIIQYLRGFQ